MTATSENSLVQDSGLVRLRRCKYGLMAFMPHDLYIGRSLDLYGEFSPGEAAMFKQILKPGMTALDVGANAGAHSVLFAQLVGPSGTVMSFEPQRAIFQLLCTNMTVNGYMQARPYMAAVGRVAGSLMVPPVDYSQSGNFGSLSLGQWEVGEKVPIIAIDDLALPNCHLIKADVEGMELDALRGAEKTIQRCKPALYIENDRAEKSKVLIEFILEQNYKVYWHITPYYTPSNYFGNADNVFGGTVSVNILAFHQDAKVHVEGAQPITDASVYWKG